jgi:Ca2+-binding EF-hand superfamily protein
MPELTDPAPITSATPPPSPRDAMRDFGDRMEALAVQYDKDGDGALSDEERRAMFDALRAEREAELLKRFDADGDGILSDAERREARFAQMMDSPWGQRMLAQYDANGDGKLNEAERAAMEADIQKQRDERLARLTAEFDRDGDGVLSQEEEQAMRQSRRARGEEMRKAFEKRFDANGDGKLDEAERAEARRVMEEFRDKTMFVRKYDSNGDDVVDAADTANYLDRFAKADPWADVNGDGTVGPEDLGLFSDTVAAGGGTLPEPPIPGMDNFMGGGRGGFGFGGGGGPGGRGGGFFDGPPGG